MAHGECEVNISYDCSFTLSEQSTQRCILLSSQYRYNQNKKSRWEALYNVCIHTHTHTEFTQEI